MTEQDKTREEQAIELLDEAAYALSLAITFMAGVFESRGMKPKKYEKEQAWKWVNDPRQRIYAWLEENHD